MHVMLIYFLQRTRERPENKRRHAMDIDTIMHPDEAQLREERARHASEMAVFDAARDRIDEEIAKVQNMANHPEDHMTAGERLDLWEAKSRELEAEAMAERTDGDASSRCGVCENPWGSGRHDDCGPYPRPSLLEVRILEARRGCADQPTDHEIERPDGFEPWPSATSDRTGQELEDANDAEAHGFAMTGLGCFSPPELKPWLCCS